MTHDPSDLDFGRLYDQQVADTYDRDDFGLLSSVRALALAQLAALPLAADATVLDLGAGTGVALAAVRDRLPRARCVAIDISARMLAVAQTRVALEAHVDDALNAHAHVADGSVDLVLAHFLTSFVDRRRLFGVARRTLRSGGLFSLTSTTREALLRLRQVTAPLLGASAVDAAAPAPPHDGTLERELAGCGLEVVALEPFRRPIAFETFDDLLAWGLSSGFLTQAVAAIGPDRVEMLRPFAAPLFPFHDEYMGLAITAVATDIGSA